MSVRDPRLIAEHRGGALARGQQAALARWASDCAERVLPFFLTQHRDGRPRHAIETGRAWAAGLVPAGAAMRASLAAHAAARKAKDPLAVAAARAAGHAAATAHCADHCMGVLLYALKIHRLRGTSGKQEVKRQLRRLPPSLRAVVRKGVLERLGQMRLPMGPGGKG